MSTAVGVLERNPIIQTPGQVSYQASRKNFPVLYSPPKYYFESSEFYQIRGGFTAEFIENPTMKIIGMTGLQQRIIYDLKRVTLAAFGKDKSQEEIYAPDQVIMKNCILVDSLTIIRKGSEVVAFASSSFLDDDILYENASMVDPKYQGSVGLGMIPPMYVWSKIFEKRPELINRLKITGRTCNQEVVSMLDHVLENMVVSGQDDLDKKDVDLFEKVASELSCNYDLETGILKEVYPEGLTKGKQKQKFAETFAKLGPKDGYLLAGKVKYMHVCRLLKRETSVIQNTYEMEVAA
jgi:hypothetical protein